MTILNKKITVPGNKNQIKWDFASQETPSSFCLAGEPGWPQGEQSPASEFLCGV